MTKIYPLSYIQKLHLLEQSYDYNSPHMNIGGYMVIEGKIHLANYRKSIRKVAENNDILRTIFVWNEDNQVSQQVAEVYEDVVIFKDFSDEPNPEKSCEDWIQLRMSKPFNIQGGMLWEMGLLLAGEKSYCYSIYHHLIADGWSIALTHYKIAENYLNLVKGMNVEQKTISYFDFLDEEKEYFNSIKYKEDKKYWLDKAKLISGYSSNIANKKRDKKISNSIKRDVVLEHEMYTKIVNYCKNNNLSIFQFFITVFLLILKIRTGNDKVLLNVRVHNRSSIRQKCSLGPFSTILPVTADFSNKDFITIFNQVIKELKDSYKHQKCALQEFYPAVVLEGQDISGAMVFSYEPNNHDYLSGFLPAEAHVLSNGRISDAIDVHIREFHKENRVFVNMYFDEYLFSEIDVAIYIEQFQLLINQFVCKGITNMSEIDLLTDKEKEVLEKMNKTEEILLKDSLSSILEDIAYKHYSATAVVCNNKNYSYEELFRDAYKVAGYLQSLGLKEEDSVAVIMEYSFQMIVAMTGIFLYRAVFVPVSNKDPIQRIRKIVSDSDSKLIITDNIMDFPYEQVLINDILNLDKIYRKNNEEFSENAPCYIVYTSGSTGEPKGVINTQKAVINVLEEWVEKYKIVVYKFVLLQTSSFAHDVFIGNYLKTIATGGVLVLPTENERLDLNKLAKLFKDNHVNTLDSTPSIVMMIVEYLERIAIDDSSLKLIIVGSDICPSNDFKKLFIKYQGRAVVINSYGVSEAAIYSTDFSVSSEGNLSVSGNLPIGKPYRNTKMYVLDDFFKQVNVGVEGELFIAGYGLARGYTSEKQTHEKFIIIKGIGRVYQTGDLARVLSDGNIQFIGRKDFQIKIRGYRIEPGEIEDCISKISGIKKVAVVTSEISSNQVLVAYYSSNRLIPMEEFVFTIKAALPNYMMPMFFQRLEALPISINGKVDRKRLMSIEVKKESCISMHDDVNENKKCVQKVWKKVLGERFNEIKSFTQMGGDSLEAIKIASELNLLGFKCSYMDIYRNLSFDDFFETYIEDKKITEISNANNILTKVFGDGVGLQSFSHEKLEKRLIYFIISKDKQFFDFTRAIDFCHDRLCFSIQPQYISGKGYPQLDADKTKNVLTKLYSSEANFFNSFSKQNFLYRIEDPTYSSDLRRYYRNVYFVTNLRFEETKIAEVKEALNQLIQQNDLLRSCLVKTGLGKYVWDIYQFSLKDIPVVDLSEFDAFSSYDFMHTVLREYFLRKNIFRKFMFRAVIVKINLSEAYLWWFMDDSIHDDYGNQLIEKYLYQITRKGYKDYPITSSYKEYLENLKVKRKTYDAKDLMQKLSLNEFENAYTNYKSYIKQMCKNNKTTNTFCFNFSKPDRIKDEFMLAIEVFILFATNHFPFHKVPIFLLHNTRFFDSAKYLNSIGAFIDEVPLTIDTSLSVEENLKMIRTNLEYINENNIHFKSILLNTKSDSKYLKKKFKTSVGKLVDNDSILLFNFKQGDIPVDEIFTETEGITIFQWLYGISFNVIILDGVCKLSIRIPYKVDFSLLNQKFNEKYGNES